MTAEAKPYEYQTDLEDALYGYAEFQFAEATRALVDQIREQRANSIGPNGGPPLESERDAQRRAFNAALKPFGWRLSAIPSRKGVGYET